MDSAHRDYMAKLILWAGDQVMLLEGWGETLVRSSARRCEQYLIWRMAVAMEHSHKEGRRLMAQRRIGFRYYADQKCPNCHGSGYGPDLTVQVQLKKRKGNPQGRLGTWRRRIRCLDCMVLKLAPDFPQRAR